MLKIIPSSIPQTLQLKKIFSLFKTNISLLLSLLLWSFKLQKKKMLPFTQGTFLHMNGPLKMIPIQQHSKSPDH